MVPNGWYWPSNACELHISDRNLITKLAYGMTPLPLSSPTYHRAKILAEYSVVSNGYKDLELDIRGGDDKIVLSQVLYRFVLWQKRYIKIQNTQPRIEGVVRKSPLPPSPPSQRSPSPPLLTRRSPTPPSPPSWRSPPPPSPLEHPRKRSRSPVPPMSKKQMRIMHR